MTSTEVHFGTMGRASGPSAALSGSQTKASGFAGGYLLAKPADHSQQTHSKRLDLGKSVGKFAYPLSSFAILLTPVLH
jgi:hypothetical protein